MARNRGEMGHKKESVKWRPRHDGRGDNVIARVRGVMRGYLAAVKRPLRGICTFHVSHLSCLSVVIA